MVYGASPNNFIIAPSVLFHMSGHVSQQALYLRFILVVIACLYKIHVRSDFKVCSFQNILLT